MKWPPTYNMSLSTFSNPDGNYTGLDSGALLMRDAQYGIITFDGNNQRCLNNRAGPPGDPCKYKSTPEDVEELARRIKAINPRTRVFTYHNQEEALLRRRQDCLIMVDPAYADFFIRNASGIVNNRKEYGHMAMCDAVADESAYSHEDQYALDFRHPNVSKWWLDNVIGRFIASPVLDGFYWDCPTVTVPFSNGLTASALADANAAMAATRAEGQERIAAAGKWALDMFSGLATPATCPMPCRLGWRPSFNCSQMCDKRPSTCVKNLQSAHSKQSEPGMMTLPYVQASGRPSHVQCDAPAAVMSASSASPLELSCVPGTGALTVEFASYGTPDVTSAGRFIRCEGDGCLQTGYVNGSMYWEDTTTRAAYQVHGGSECTRCLHRRECVVGTVTPQYFASLNIALEGFTCAAQRHCSVFAKNSSCDAGPGVLAQLKAQCDGKQSCSIDLKSLSLPPPAEGCGRNPLNLAVRATGCKQGTAVADFRENLAAFLLVRGPHSWMGNGWIASQHPTWHPEWDVDYGEPLGDMVVTGNVATREWSKFNVSLDCNTFTAEFTPL